MSKKNRFRTKTIAFRMSETEKAALEENVRLYGYRTKQDYIISALLNHEVKAVGNPLMFIQFKKVLECTETAIKNGKPVDDEVKRCLFEILKILKCFEK